jgi:hypothetical protein
LIVQTEPLDAWEACWAPYDKSTYQTALEYIYPDDIVLDIGAGDLSFARSMAQKARHVYAIELQAGLLANQTAVPDNMTVICADARTVLWPDKITVGVLLMRHCRHFKLYATRLLGIGCKRLVTNARWGMDVESVPLGQRMAWHSATKGWFACLCGEVGFIESEPSEVTLEAMETINEVVTCPVCDTNSLLTGHHANPSPLPCIQG